MKINDDIPRLEAEEKIKLDIDFENLNIKRKRNFSFLIVLLLILLALIGGFIVKKTQSVQESSGEIGPAIDVSAERAWHGAFKSEEIFNACREASVSIIAQGKRCSGFVYSSDGWIATVEGAVNENVKGQIEVVLCDGRRFCVESFRQCREVGLILMKIDASGLKAVDIEKNGEIFAGDELFTFCAVGDVYEGGSLFSGKIAHIQRRVEIYAPDGSKRDLKLMQIGILLTEEGVGAPLFNEEGNLLGIACASNVDDERYMIDYAFEYAKVKNILKMMKNGERADYNEIFEVIVK